MASIGAIFTSTYHAKQLNPWLNSSASRVVNYSQLSVCQGDVEPFEGSLSTHGCLASLRNKPQQKQPRQLSASILAWIVNQCVRLLFDGEKCALLLCAWKPIFLKSSHIHIYIYNFAWEDKRQKWCYIVHIALWGVNSAILFVYRTRYAYGKKPEGSQKALSLLDKTVRC